MKLAKWMLGLTLGFLVVSVPSTMAQGNSQVHGHGKGHDKNGDGDDRDDDHGYYRERDHDIREWYTVHREDLPPGLAKKDRLPPGLEKQLVLRPIALTWWLVATSCCSIGIPTWSWTSCTWNCSKTKLSQLRKWPLADC